MFRVILTIALIPCLVGGQLAAFRHVHAGMSQEEQIAHDASPHVHTGSHAKHTHEHVGHHHHSHVSCDAGHSPGDANSIRESVSIEHDRDAIYVQPVKVLAHQSLPSIDMHDASIPVAIHQVCWGVVSQRFTSSKWHPPDKLGQSSDLYLVLRNLRI